MSDWQPIATAPKDGTPILAFYPGQWGIRSYSVRSWQRGTWGGQEREAWADDIMQIRVIEPTHWKPLDPPKSVE
jgi:hypothetical protein